MQLRDGSLTLSPSDLSGFLACEHLTQLELSVARGERHRPVFEDPHRDMLRRKGFEHESAYLARLETQGKSVLRIPTFGSPDFDLSPVYRIDGTPKTSIPKLVLREIKKKVGLKNAISDVFTAWRAL